MPLRPRSNPSAPSSPKQARKATRGRQKNYALIMGLALGLLAAVLVAVGLGRLQNQGEVMVAVQGIPMYSQVKDSSLKAVTVPADSITANDITPQELAAYRKQGGLVTRVEVLPGQRLQDSALAASSVGSFAVVKADERIVALNTTFAGIAAGAVVPGSVVDVLSDGDSTTPVIVSAKVLAVGQSNDVAQQVENSSAKPQSSGQSGLVVLLAVKAADANKLAKIGDVQLAVNPRLSFNSSGTLCKVGSCSKGTSSYAPADSTSVAPDTSVDPNQAVDPAAPIAPSGN
jgi:Flp pilus assembly protein CpaB